MLETSQQVYAYQVCATKGVASRHADHSNTVIFRALTVESLQVAQWLERNWVVSKSTVDPCSQLGGQKLMALVLDTAVWQQLQR